MYQKKREEDIRSPLDFGISKLDGKWNTRILCELFSSGTLRYSELKARNLGLTDSVLSSTLSCLISSGLVTKDTRGRQHSLASSYTLTHKGKEVVHILKDICHLVTINEASTSYKIPSYCQNCEGLQKLKA